MKGRLEETKHYDAIIIGSGQAGTPLSFSLADAGWKVAIIEREFVGGTCINRGCTPTKTMVASARAAYMVRRASGYGVNAKLAGVNLARVRQRKQTVVETFRKSSQSRMERTDGLELIFGEAQFTGRQTLLVRVKEGQERSLSANRIFINTGARPFVPEISGFSRVKTLDSTSIMELDVIPSHLLVVGGGYIGLEFSQMFRRFGSRVTIFHRGRQLLSREDNDVAEAVAAILSEEGIEILLDSQVLKAEEAPEGGIDLTFRQRGIEQRISGSHLLVAVGRVPNTQDLNLPAAGVSTDSKGFVVVNDRLETSVSGIYALGDVKGGPAFTHISYDDFRIIKANLLEKGNRTTRNRIVPYTVFIDPQLGRVGLTESEARMHGYNVQTARMPMSYVARAIEMDDTRGFMKAVVDGSTGQILGAAVLGIEGGELMTLFMLAMMGRLPYTDLRDAVFAHPTLAESLNNLFSTMTSAKSQTV